jgi:DNA-binding transcriptional ArsR family regulator
MVKKRGEATRKILDRLEKGPAFPKQISDELGIPKNTVNYNLSKVLPDLGLVIQLPDGKYVTKWWSSEKYKVERAYEEFHSKLFRCPLAEEIAGSIGETPSNARDLLFKYIPNYSEPSEYEVRTETEKVWWSLMTYALDWPTHEEILNEGIDEILIVGMDESALKFLLLNRNVINGHNRDDCPQENEFINKKYFEENPDMTPKLHRSRNDNRLCLQIFWQNFAKNIFGKLPGFYKTCLIKL